MTDRPDLKMVPPLPAGVMGVLSDDEFGEALDAFTNTGTAWSMRDMNDAEFAARKLLAARRKIEEVNAQGHEWLRQIGEWIDGNTASAREIEAWAVAALTAYAVRWRKETEEATLKLPSIVVKTTHVPGAVVVEDPAAFVEWAKANRPEAIKTEWKPIAKEVAKLDESLPGLAYRDDRISVTL